ncbi:hypothetical protein FB446DRAFT_147093 [Lentinula raphanica]|nr:hypothetical protein FB446DRAFT_147093 [Lentinula raphanica]
MLFYPPNRRGSSIGSIIFLAMIIALVADISCSARPTDKRPLLTYDPSEASLQNIPEYSGYAERLETEPFYIHPDLCMYIKFSIQDVIEETFTKLEPSAPPLGHFEVKEHSVRVFEFKEGRHHFYLPSKVEIPMESSVLTLSGFLVVQPRSETEPETGSAVYHYSAIKTGEHEARHGTFEPSNKVTTEIWKLLVHPEIE